MVAMKANDDLHRIKANPINKCNIILDREAEIIKASQGLDVCHIGCVGVHMEDIFHLRLAHECKYLLGVDINMQGLDMMKKNYPNMQYAFFNLEDKRKDELPHHWISRFDVIVLGEVVEHVGNAMNFIKRASDMLKKDGQIIITVPNAFSLRSFVNIALANAELVRTDHTSYYSYTTIQTLLESCNCEILNLDFYSDITTTSNKASRFFKILFNKTVLVHRPAIAEGIFIKARPIV